MEQLKICTIMMCELCGTYQKEQLALKLNKFVNTYVELRYCRPHKTLMVYLAIVLLHSRKYQIGLPNFVQVSLISQMNYILLKIR